MITDNVGCQTRATRLVALLGVLCLLPGNADPSRLACGVLRTEITRRLTTCLRARWAGAR